VTDRCGHAPLAEELRACLSGALDLFDALVERIREQIAAEAPPGQVVCTACPVCALIAVLRGERSELAARLADHASGLVAVLRTALYEGAGIPGGGSTPAPPPAPRPHSESAPPSPRFGGTRVGDRRTERAVQHIPISTDRRPERSPGPTREPC
jgi:hypothetical protein